MLSGTNNNVLYTDAVWHFNTTSFLWTFIAGSVTQNDTAHNSTFYGGAYRSGCDIDDNDRVWVYGGYGYGGAYGDLWTFDTRTKRQWEFEYGADTKETSAVVVSNDFDSGNRPPAAQNPVLIDRRDGTLMLVPGFVSRSDTSPANSNTVWQYSKSLKQWRLVYGNISEAELNAPGKYTNFRAPGSAMPAQSTMGKAAGKNTNGDLYLIGGWQYSTFFSAPNSKDIWLIPQDQCSNNIHECDVNADCVEEMIGYSCKCKDGFTCTGPPAQPVAGTPSSTTSGASIGTSVLSALIITLAIINI